MSTILLPKIGTLIKSGAGTFVEYEMWGTAEKSPGIGRTVPEDAVLIKKTLPIHHTDLALVRLVPDGSQVNYTELDGRAKLVFIDQRNYTYIGITKRIDFNWFIFQNDPLGGEEKKFPVYGDHLSLCVEGRTFKFTLHNNAADGKMAKLIPYKELSGFIVDDNGRWCVEYIDGDYLIVDYPPEGMKPEVDYFSSNIKKILVHPDQQRMCRGGQNVEFRITKYYYSSSSIQGGETESMDVARILDTISTEHTFVSAETIVSKDKELRIYAVAYAMWLSKYSGIRGPEDQWLNYWQHYDVFMVHEKKNTYLQHARNMEPGKKINP